MTKNHLKRNVANKSWILLRKENKYVIKPSAGKHKIKDCVPLGYLLKNLGFVQTTKEAKKLLLLNNVLVDKKKVMEIKYPIGFMDVISVNDKNLRCAFDNKGRICFIDIDEADSNKKICKILEKSKVKQGKTQLNLSDGRNILVDKDEFKVGDSIVLELPSQKIIKNLSFNTGALILLTGGKHIGSTGFIEKILPKHILFKDEKGNKFPTLKKYGFVIGTNKPEFKIK